ncbi:MAG: type I-E CRISPR-associated protein Cas6/Cse3/CasE [Alphaproteobacteria bacterium]|nr:type I-E CRISPR-associated protein Cas6/Cse3/CasE [Alphaproteobacteria bacterium]
MAYFSRIALRQDSGGAGALAAVLREVATDHGGAHRLVWSLFSRDGNETRDFLFRQEPGTPGRFLTVSQRPPVDRHDLWVIDTKDYAPAIRDGSRLRFILRANPTISRRDGQREQRHDVVMDAKTQARQADKTIATDTMINGAATEWLIKKGDRHGFTVSPGNVAVDGYTRTVFRHVNRHGKHGDIVLSSVDFDGSLGVTDPDRFERALVNGIGRARAFGFGLLLVRPAR